MNQKGFGRFEVIGFIAVVALSMTIVWLLTNQLMNSKPAVSHLSGVDTVTTPASNDNKAPIPMEFDVGTYPELEKKIAEKSMSYFEVNQTDDVQVVTIAKLVQNSYIPQVYSLKNHDVICTGYVEYHHDTNIASTYLKCDQEYQTPGYNVLND